MLNEQIPSQSNAYCPSREKGKKMLLERNVNKQERSQKGMGKAGGEREK